MLKSNCENCGVLEFEGQSEFEMDDSVFKKTLKQVHDSRREVLEQMEDVVLAAMCAGVPASSIVVRLPELDNDTLAVTGAIGFKPL